MKKYVKSMNDILSEGFVPVSNEDGVMVTIKDRIQKMWKQISAHKYELLEVKRTNVNV